MMLEEESSRGGVIKRCLLEPHRRRGCKNMRLPRCLCIESISAYLLACTAARDIMAEASVIMGDC